MILLRMGSRGDQVRTLQRSLRTVAPQLSEDGIFGPRTERAVRLFQRRAGLYPPDGIAGPRTMSALSGQGQARTAPRSEAPTAPVQRVPRTVERARQRAVTGPMPAGEATPVAGMHLSRRGRRFIYDHEAQANVSHRLHHPTSGSGVTIGPGYDMKERSSATVQRDLEAIQVPREQARAAAQGAGLSGNAATRFVRENQSTLNLTRGQQEALLVHIAPQYEAKVKRAITVPLHQHEFDAMVSYAYNPGGG